MAFDICVDSKESEVRSCKVAVACIEHDVVPKRDTEADTCLVGKRNLMDIEVKVFYALNWDFISVTTRTITTVNTGYGDIVHGNLGYANPNGR